MTRVFGELGFGEMGHNPPYTPALSRHCGHTCYPVEHSWTSMESSACWVVMRSVWPRS